eukprot:TRINITY_DN1906_c0_g1_i2.p1 TRINITY_DN1906_c0_g1~~TRINITY_DN1906_c0_g1_i2.p1  ORF type:complete len:720 (+),score=105.36 TRINITY_DN1906_c0_g1_i2:92-2161(+)
MVQLLLTHSRKIFVKKHQFSHTTLTSPKRTRTYSILSHYQFKRRLNSQYSLQVDQNGQNSNLLSSQSGKIQIVDLEYEEMVERLQLLVQHRRISRKLLRADFLLQLKSPIYLSYPFRDEEQPDESNKLESTEEEYQRLKSTVDIISEMQQLSDQLRQENWTLKDKLSVLYDETEALSTVRSKLSQVSDELKARAKQETMNLPQKSLTAAYRSLEQMQEILTEEVGGPIVGRLEKAEKRAEQFVVNKLQPTVRLVRDSEDVGAIFRDAAVYAKELWIRLNGGAILKDQENCPLPPVPQPQSLRDSRMKALQDLEFRAEALEKQLQQVSNVREQKLKKAGVKDRTQLAFILRDFDTDVMQLSRQLALCTLQTMLQHIYLVLEEELLDTAGDDQLRRSNGKNISDELAFLVAEFSLLSEQLSSVSPTIVNVRGPLLQTIDDQLEKLVVDVDDMRMRLGIPDRSVFGMESSETLNIRKAQIQMQLQMQEMLEKITEGADFFGRGIKLMFQDIANAGRLFSRAALGYNLKRREVSALRRTLRDILTFIPFAIILIIPLTPVGHVLVFGFIQKYFPNFFPSQFNVRRQAVMQKYEQLMQQLQDARKEAYEEEDFAELNKAAEAVARLTGQGRQNVLAGLKQSGKLSKDATVLLNKMMRDDEYAPGPKAKELEKLEKQVKLAERDTIYRYAEEDAL